MYQCLPTMLMCDDKLLANQCPRQYSCVCYLFPKVSCSQITVGAGEIVQLVRGLVFQAWGPEVKSPAPTEKSKCGPMYIYDPRDVGVGTVTSLWLTGLKPSSRFSETPCLKWMKLREIEKDTQCHPLASPHILASMNILHTHYTHMVFPLSARLLCGSNRGATWKF